MASFETATMRNRGITNKNLTWRSEVRTEPMLKFSVQEARWITGTGKVREGWLGQV
jgi:hypothetical protein